MSESHAGFSLVEWGLLTAVHRLLVAVASLAVSAGSGHTGLSEYIMRNAGLEEAQAGIKLAGRNINNFRYADDTTLMPESEEEL